nr:MAG TPA: terminase small subunit [Caudoviricetes sp.]
MAKGKYQEWLEPEGLLKIEGWARDGLTDEQIAQNMGINPTTLYEWKKKYPKISESLKRSKDVADRQVENALFKNAINGNITAQIFWLKNRKPDKWRDKQEYEDRTAIEKLDEILKGMHDNAAKPKTE